MRSSTGVLPPRSIPAPATRSRSSQQSRSGRCGERQTLDLNKPKNYAIGFERSEVSLVGLDDSMRKNRHGTILDFDCERKKGRYDSLSRY